MLQLSPNESFPIVRVLKDHTDAGTNYVQAVIRNATTDAILATLNLVDLGNRRFRYIWHVPYDNVFQIGKYIVITTTVYTDSGYTLKNANYFEEADTYLVQERWNANKIFAGGAHGPDVDYKKIREMIVEVVGTIPPNEKVDVDSVMRRITDVGERVLKSAGEIKQSIAAIPAPEPHKEVDFKPLIALAEATMKAISGLPQHKDNTAVVAQMKALQDTVASMSSLQTALEKVHENISTANDKAQKIIDKKQIEFVLKHEMEFTDSKKEKSNSYLEGLKKKYAPKA